LGFVQPVAPDFSLGSGVGQPHVPGGVTPVCELKAHIRICDGWGAALAPQGWGQARGPCYPRERIGRARTFKSNAEAC